MGAGRSEVQRGRRGKRLSERGRGAGPEGGFGMDGEGHRRS